MSLEGTPLSLAHCSILLINMQETEIALWKFLFLKSYFFIVRKNILEAHSFCWVSLCKKLLEACGNPIKLVIIFIFEGQIHGINFPVLLNAASQAFTVTCVFPADTIFTQSWRIFKSDKMLYLCVSSDLDPRFNSSRMLSMFNLRKFLELLCLFLLTFIFARVN